MIRSVPGVALVLAGIALAVVAIASFGCYKGDPVCDPSTVDWPRCRPWDPPLVGLDGGVER